MKNRNDRKESLLTNSQGFTLIEAIISLVVLVIGIVGVLSMQLITIKGNSNAMAISRSLQEISAVIDRTQALAYDANDLSVGTGQAVDPVFFGAPDNTIPHNLTGTITYDVAEMNNNQIRTQVFNLTNDNFSASTGKMITVNSVQQSAGSNRTITLQYFKVD